MKKSLLRFIAGGLIAFGPAVPDMNAEITCLYWFDSETDLSNAKTETFAGESFRLNVDATALPYGLHKVNVMVGSSDKWSPALCRIFFKPEPVAENVSRKLQVNVDGVKVMEKSLVAGSDIVTIDASKLPTGLHRLDCLVLSSTGEDVTTGQKLFYKPEPEMSRNDWTMTFFADGQQLWEGKLPEGEDVVMLDASQVQSGITQLVCLFTSSETGESIVAVKKDFYRPYDSPNSITGYLSEAGSEYVGKNVRQLGYTVQFENGCEENTEPVNTIELKTVLPSEIFDSSSFGTREVRIGGKLLSLNGRKSFHEKLDLRPERNAMADVVCEFDNESDTVTWRIQSLDPETSEPTDNKELAVFPANIDGWGMAEILYDVNLRGNLADGTIVENSAVITMDGNDVANPSWRNILDLSLPESRIVSVTETVGGYEFEITGSDTGSGIWKYELYRQNSTDGTWELVMTDIYDTHFVYLTEKSEETPRFATVAIDKAGNAEVLDITSGIGDIQNDNNEDDTYYMLNGVKAPGNYNGIKVGKNKKLLKTNH